MADCTPLLSNSHVPAGKVKYKDLNSNWAHPGDVIAINAVPCYYYPDTDVQASPGTAGTLDFSRSPFTGTIPSAWMEQSIRTRIYRCVFYTRKNIRTINGFSGVCGSFSAKTSPGTSGTGKWKALGQQVRTCSGGNGKIYTKVERTMLEAPGNLTWDPDKNGGTWSW